MQFTDESKQRLLELINNIQPSMASKNPGRIILPLRLLVSTLEVLEEVYDADTIATLSDAEVRLFLNSFHGSIVEMSSALRRTISLLPESVPSALVDKNETAVLALQGLKTEREQLTEQIDGLLATADEVLAEQKQIDELKSRREALLNVPVQVDHSSIEDLRKEVSILEESIGPLQAEVFELKNQLDLKRKATSPLRDAVERTKLELQNYERSGREHDELLDIIRAFQEALQPHLHRASDTIKVAEKALQQKVKDSEKLLEDSKDMLDKVGQAFIGAKRTQSLLTAHADGNASVAGALPGVPAVTMEKLRDVEQRLRETQQQLGEIDSQLKEALERHQESSAIIQQLAY